MLHYQWFTYWWPSDKGNGPENIQWTVLALIVASFLIPAVRNYFKRVEAKLDHIITHHPEIPAMEIEFKEWEHWLVTLIKFIVRPFRKGPPMPTKTFQRGLHPLNEEKHARFKFAADYGFTFPSFTYPIDKSGGITDYGMDGNGPDPTLTVNGGNPVGDCGVCAVPAHANMIDAVLAGLSLSEYTMTSNEVVNLYFEYTGGKDVGVDLGDWLLWLFNKGLIKGFVKLQLSEMDAALALGLIVVVGVNLNPNADEQVNAGIPWSVGPGDEPDPEDGHAILRMAVNMTRLVKWCTWGQGQWSTEAWDQACPQQAFGVVTNPDVLTSNGFPYEALLADLTALGGTVAPTSAPTPAPKPPAKTLEQKIEAIWNEALAKIKALFA